MISDTQTALLNILLDARTNSSNPDYPAIIENYAGQLRDPKQYVLAMPAVYVDVPVNFELNGIDAPATELDGDFYPEIVCFCENLAGKEEEASDGAKLIDWIINAIRGQIITVNGFPVTVSNSVKARLLTDFEDFAGILTLNMGIYNA